MSFTKTISVFAALGSIFGASVIAYKLVHQEPQLPSTLEEKIVELEKQLEELKTQKPVEQVVQPLQTPPPEPVILPPVPETPTEQ